MSKDGFWNRSEWVNSGVWVRVGIVELGARRWWEGGISKVGIETNDMNKWGVNTFHSSCVHTLSTSYNFCGSSNVRKPYRSVNKRNYFTRDRKNGG